MSKKPDPKKSAKKAAPAPKAKAKPAAKPAPKVVAKPAAKAPAPKGKAAAPVKAAKAAPAPAAKPAKKGAAPVAPAKNAKAAPAAKGKPTKAPKVDHAAQKGMLDKHRDVHHQSAALEVPVRPKLQYYTLADLRAYLDKRNKSKSKDYTDIGV
jgi:DnaK suppressor protein